MPTTLAPETSVRLHVTALHENAMLARITTVIALYDIDQFSYRTEPDGRAEAIVGVRDARQVERVASKINRVVGVLHVQVEGLPTGPTG
jgi:(p)ppGpp synthase/HD superfamily hydrolase